MADDKPFKFVDATAEVASYHVQIRVDQPGPPKRDGRKGRIIIEDPAAPVEVARWLRSAQCKRADRSTGRDVIIWVDDRPVPLYNLDAPDADLPDIPDEAPQLPAPQIPPGASKEAIAMVGLYQQRIEKLTEGLEDQLQAVRARYKEEVAAARQAAQEEIARCDAQIEASRARLEVERAREDDELESMSERRRQLAEERSALAEDLKKDSDTYRSVREQLAGSVQGKDTIASLVEGVGKLQEAGVPVGELIAKLAGFLASKVPTPTP